LFRLPKEADAFGRFLTIFNPTLARLRRAGSLRNTNMEDLTMTTTDDYTAFRDWLERVMTALPTLSSTEFEIRQPYTLVVSRDGTEVTFTMVVHAADPGMAARRANTALRAIPIPPQVDGRGPFAVVDIFQGDVDLNEIDTSACSLSHLLPHE
jgi:hypothetical protein